jgi:hypothetical protein
MTRGASLLCLKKSPGASPWHPAVIRGASPIRSGWAQDDIFQNAQTLALSFLELDKDAVFVE